MALIMKNLISKIIVLRSVLGKFSIVGLSGILINQGILILLHQFFDVDIRYAGIIAIELSIISNFLLNNFWTWQKGLSEGLLIRFFKYHLVTLFSGGVNYGTLLILTSLNIHYFLANLIGIGIGMVINFIINHNWTFKIQEITSDATK